MKKLIHKMILTWLEKHLPTQEEINKLIAENGWDLAKG